MTTYEITYRNPVRLDDGRYDCEIKHPVYGWVPFTADPNDVAPHGRMIWATINEAQGKQPG